MRAVILAAGEGRRLGHLTQAMPKPMLEVAGHPILEHNLRFLARHGVVEIAINVHHFGQQIIDHFGDGSSFGVRLRYSFEPKLRGTAGALLPVADFLTDTFVVLFGDNLSTCDLHRLSTLHRSREAVATLALFWRQDPQSGGIAQIEDDQRIRRFVEKPLPGQVFSNWVNAGIIAAEPSILSYIPRDVPSDVGYDLLPKLIADDRPVYGYRMNERLWWVDTVEDYERTRREFPAHAWVPNGNGIS
jgi:NDP-sugar pyrophosphorylase family protein